MPNIEKQGQFFKIIQLGWKFGIQLLLFCKQRRKNLYTEKHMKPFLKNRLVCHRMWATNYQVQKVAVLNALRNSCCAII